jgi:hypothetical protein
MWSGDGREFLGWLSKGENLRYVGDLMNIRLELESLSEDQEHKEPMLVCREGDTRARFLVLSPVIRSSDSELGKALVYSSRYSPTNLVLMAGSFGPTHLAALSWLNSISNRGIQVFGLEIEFWRIGNSALAPNFNLLVTPDRAESNGHVPETPASESEPESDFDEQTGTLSRLESVMPRDDDEFEAAHDEHPELGSAEPNPAAPDRAPQSESNEAESPITPSGLRRMFSSRGFSSAISGHQPKTDASEKSSPPESVIDPANKDTSPIGAANNQQENRSGMVANWEASHHPADRGGGAAGWTEPDTTVTPSGMLHRLRTHEDQPVDRSPSIPPRANGGVSSELYVEFWEQFLNDVMEYQGQHPSEKAMAQGWVSFPFEREEFSLVAFLNETHRLAGIGLVIDGPQNKAYFNILSRDRVEIEAELGASLDWRELPERDESHIYLHRKDVEVSNRVNWQDYQNWFADALEAYTRVFGNRIESLGSTILWGE